MFSSIFLAPFGFSGGNIGNFLLQLEQLGVFSFLLPFLIIFSLIFGILSTINLFENNKAINAIISLSVGLMALQFGFVSNFFSELFPRLGVGLAIILVFLIFLGLFREPEDKWMNYVMMLIGTIIVISILIQSAAFSGSSFGFFISQFSGLIIGVIIVFVLIAAVIGSAGGKKNRVSGGASQSPWLKFRD